MNAGQIGPNVPTMRQRTVSIVTDGATLLGELCIPGATSALVLFAHGSGSNRRSVRNRSIAAALHKLGIATLLIDMFSTNEQNDQTNFEMRFDMQLLSRRLQEAVAWLQADPDTRAMTIGILGASSGAGAAFQTASLMPDAIRAVVSRGGRPDLVLETLPAVKCPSLLIVGEMDDRVLTGNQRAYKLLASPKRFAIISGASHLFEEPGALEQVQICAGKFFQEHLFYPHCKTGAA